MYHENKFPTFTTNNLYGLHETNGKHMIFVFISTNVKQQSLSFDQILATFLISTISFISQLMIHFFLLNQIYYFR